MGNLIIFLCTIQIVPKLIFGLLNPDPQEAILLLPTSILVICTIGVLCKIPEIYDEIIISMFVVDRGFFPFHRLPLHLQETIISLLPISTLIVCTNVSRSFQSLIRSQSFLSSYNNSQPLFLFSNFLNPPTGLTSWFPATAYDPLSDRWLSLSFPSNAHYSCASAGPLLLSESLRPPLGFLLFNSFSFHQLPIQIPHLITDDYEAKMYRPVALISQPPYNDFKIVMVNNTLQGLRSWAYDSRTQEWVVNRGLGWRYDRIVNGVVLEEDGLLYCVTRCPVHLLAFDPMAPRGSLWRVVDVALPSAVDWPHVLAFDGKLFLVGGVMEAGYVTRIGIWERDWVTKEWWIHCFMPDDVFTRFVHEDGRQLSQFQTAHDRNGKICFYSTGLVFMYDLKVNRWWRTERMYINNSYSYVHVLEPYLDLVKGNK